MKLGVINRISKEMLSRAGDIPKWFDAALEPLNEFIEKVGRALQGGLTFEDNFLCKIVSQKFTHQTALQVNPYPTSSRALRVQGVMHLGSELQIDAFGWTQRTDGNIDVQFSFIGGSESTCKILILLG